MSYIRNLDQIEEAESFVFSIEDIMFVFENQSLQDNDEEKTLLTKDDGVYKVIKGYFLDGELVSSHVYCVYDSNC